MCLQSLCYLPCLENLFTAQKVSREGKNVGTKSTDSGTVGLCMDLCVNLTLPRSFMEVQKLLSLDSDHAPLSILLFTALTLTLQ